MGCQAWCYPLGNLGWVCSGGGALGNMITNLQKTVGVRILVSWGVMGGNLGSMGSWGNDRLGGNLGEN